MYITGNLNSAVIGAKVWQDPAAAAVAWVFLYE